MPIAKRPVGHACVETRRRDRRHHQLVGRVGCKHHGPPAEVALHRRRSELLHLRTEQSSGKIAGQLEQRLRAALAAGRNAGLVAQARRELPRQQADDQHHGKGDDILHIADRERKAGRNEEKIECRHVQNGGERGGTSTILHGDGDGAQHEQHHDVGQVQVAKQRRRRQRDHHAAKDGAPIPQPGPAPCPLRPLLGYPLHDARQAPRTGSVADFHNVQGRGEQGQARCQCAPPQPPRQARRLWTAHHQHGAIEFLRLGHQFGRGGTPGQHRGRRAEFFGQLEDGENVVAPRDVQALQPRRLDIRRMPAHVELARQARGRAHCLLGPLPRPHARENGARGVPYRCDRLLHPVTAHVVFHVFRSAAQGNLPQRDQVALAEKVLRGAFGLLRQVHLAGLEAADQFVRRDIDQDDLVGAVEHRVGHRLVDPNAGDGAHGAVQALKVLDVEGRPDIDACVQQLLHVLPSLVMARPFDVRMRQFIDQHYVRLARQGGVQVELLERAAAVRHVPQRQQGQPGEKVGGLAAAMGLNHTDQHVAPGFQLPLRRAEQGVGFPHAGAGAEVDAQLAPRPSLFLLLYFLQQCVGIGALAVGCSH